MIFCYLNDNASIDVLRRSFLLLRLPILRVHKLPLLSLKFMLCKIIVYAVFKVRRDSLSLPFRPPTAEHFFFVLAAACSPMPSPA